MLNQIFFGFGGAVALIEEWLLEEIQKAQTAAAPS